MPRAPLVPLLLCLPVLSPLHAHDRRDRHPAGERVLDRTYTLATLSARQARRLHGRLASYRVTLATDDDREGEWDVYGWKSWDAVERTLWMPGDQETQDEMIVRVVLRVIHHKGSVTPSGTRFPAFTEYRLVWRLSDSKRQ
jgi:hypothetical protein